MFKVTIEAASMDELAEKIYDAHARLNHSETAPATSPKPRGGRKTATAQSTVDASDDAAPSPTVNEPEDAALQAELNAPVDPMPATAAAVVDAGTGQPIASAGGVPKSEPPLQMTFDDVKLAAGKLAAKDMSKLAALLKKYGAANLSGVPKDKLGDFAMDVLEANEA